MRELWKIFSKMAKASVSTLTLLAIYVLFKACN